MFDNLVNRKFIMVLPVAAAIMLTGCKEEEAASAPAPEPVDLSQTEDLFAEPVKANPLTSDPSAVIVRVNGEDITRGEILELMNAAMQQFGGRVPPQQMQQLQAQMYEQFKNDLINKKLIDAAVAKAGVTVSEEEIAQTLEGLKGRVPEGQTLETVLAAQGTSVEELKENIKTDMATRQFLEAKAETAAAATETDAKAFYDSNPDEFKKQEAVTASHILIKFEETDTEETKAAKKEILTQIRTDIIAEKITFEDAAKQHSGCPSSERGGSLGSFGRGQMVPEFDAVAFTQEVDEVGDIVETKFGYHIIKVSERSIAGEVVPFEEAKEQIMTYLSGQNKRQAVQDYINSLRDGATIEEISL